MAAPGHRHMHWERLAALGFRRAPEAEAAALGASSAASAGAHSGSATNSSAPTMNVAAVVWPDGKAYVWCRSEGRALRKQASISWYIHALRKEPGL